VERVAPNAGSHEEAGVGANHLAFRTFNAAVKLTVGFDSGHIARASRSRSALVLRGRLPALVTISAGFPLSVTMMDSPDRMPFIKPGE
jgi:hypothetical protein